MTDSAPGGLHAIALGTRVVLRYRLPPGSSHTMSDIVGELLSHAPVAVRDSRGNVVEVPAAEVVALKPVGPPVRAKADIRALECAAVDGWPGNEQEWLDGWLLRAGGGYTRRANSAAPLDNPSLSAETLERIERWYQRRLLRPQLVIPDRLAAVPAGWERQNETVVLTAGLADLPLPAGPPVMRVDAAPDSAWLAAYSHHGKPVPSGLTALLPAVRSGLVAFGTLGQPEPMAIGRVAITAAPDGRRWAGLTAIQVAPRHRRRGLAGLLCGELLRWSIAQGATDSYVTVDLDNSPALRLYEGMGFGEHHRHWYAVK